MDTAPVEMEESSPKPEEEELSPVPDPPARTRLNLHFDPSEGELEVAGVQR